MKKILLSTLLLGLMFASALPSYADSGNRATHTITATLGQELLVTRSPDSVTSATINPDDGILSNELKPSFTIETNCPLDVTMKAAVSTDTGEVNAFATRDTGTTFLLVLGNDTSKPTAAAVENITVSTNTIAKDANVDAIAYSFTSNNDRSLPSPSFASNTFTFSDVPTGKTNLTNQTGTTPIANTFGSYKDALATPLTIDKPGDYKAIITCEAVAAL